MMYLIQKLKLSLKAIGAKYAYGLFTPLILLLLMISACQNAQQDAEKKDFKTSNTPNIIVIIPDDMGWSDIGYNGSAIKTPHLDQLAKEGVKLNHQYVMATCTPSRVGIFTGQYASNFGITGPAYGEVIPPGTPTLASELDKKGYFTALVGKWHMGSPPYVPGKYGFQSAYGYLDGQVDPYIHTYKKVYAHQNVGKDTAIMTNKTWFGEGAFLQDIPSGVKVEDSPEFPHFKFIRQKGHATDLITDQAIRVIKKEKAHPFFMYLAYSAPHFPLKEPKEWLSMYEDTFVYSSRRRFAASVTHMDNSIGEIIKTLQQTKQRSNTIILFISDNGAQQEWSKEARKRLYDGKYADVPHNVLGNNYPLRGWKDELYEGGIRTPAFISWPEHLEPGAVNVPTKWTDWLPTFLSVTGSSEEEIDKLHLDGDNIWPLLTGEKTASDYAHRSFFWETPHSYAVRKDSFKLIRHKKNHTIELYNIEKDFRELNEISKSHSDEVRKLESLLAKFKSRDE